MVESDNEDPSARKADIKKATSLFKECLGVEPTVTNAVRIGKASKPRLLKLILQNLNDKVFLCKMN